MKALRAGTVLTLPAILFCLSASAALANHSSVPNVNVEEGAPVATIWVHSDCGPRGTYRTEDGSAKAGEDYEAQTGQFSRPEEGVRPGSRSFQIPLIDDKIKESDETVRVIVTLAPENVMFGAGTAGCGTSNYNEVQTIEATLTIIDDETPRAPTTSGSGPSSTSNRSSSGSTRAWSTGAGPDEALQPGSERAALTEDAASGVPAGGTDTPNPGYPDVRRAEPRSGASLWLPLLILGIPLILGALLWRRKLSGRVT